MSDKQFEQCTLEEATHVEVKGVTYFLGHGKVLLAYDEDDRVGISVVDACAFIPVDAFPILGIKPMRERKREPIEFEAIVKASMASYFFLGNVPEGVPLGTKFKCVEILEEKK